MAVAFDVEHDARRSRSASRLRRLVDRYGDPSCQYVYDNKPVRFVAIGDRSELRKRVKLGGVCGKSRALLEAEFRDNEKNWLVFR